MFVLCRRSEYLVEPSWVIVKYQRVRSVNDLTSRICRKSQTALVTFEQGAMDGTFKYVNDEAIQR